MYDNWLELKSWFPINDKSASIGKGILSPSQSLKSRMESHAEAGLLLTSMKKMYLLQLHYKEEASLQYSTPQPCVSGKSPTVAGALLAS